MLVMGEYSPGSPIGKGHNQACGVGQCHLLPLWKHSGLHLTSLSTAALLAEALALSHM